MSAKLGDRQKEVLLMMHDWNGVWFSGCGWYWGTASETEEVMHTLERRGLVVSKLDGAGSIYTLTADGRVMVGRIKGEHTARQLARRTS